MVKKHRMWISDFFPRSILYIVKKSANIIVGSVKYLYLSNKK